MTAVRRLFHRRARRERGAVAVEAALITPLLLIIVFGIIEFSLVMRDSVSISSSVRVGARMASTAAGDGTVCTIDPDPACTATNAPAAAQKAADAIAQAGSVMPKDSIEYIYVYRANNKGYPGADGSTTMPDPSGCSAAIKCVQYTWQASTDRFSYTGGGWDSTTINACANTEDAESVGIYMKTEHDFITGLFGQTLSLSDRAVMKFEPLTWETCAPGDHL